MKSFIRLFLLFSMILASLLVSSDGQCQIIRHPVNLAVEQDVFAEIPNFLLETVETKLKTNDICSYGINVCEIQDMNERRSAVNLIFKQVAEEVTNLLDRFTGKVIEMIRLKENNISLETRLDNIHSMVLRLNTCLEHLYNNGANVTQALDRYLFLRDITFVYRAVHGADAVIEKNHLLDLIKKKTNVDFSGDEDVLQKTYLSLSNEAKRKIFYYTTFYSRRDGCGWLNTDRLKWKTLMTSQSSWAMVVQRLLFSVSGKSLRQRYDEIAAEVDSVKVIAFYAEVAETVTALVAKRAFDVVPLLVDYLLVMINGSPSNDPIEHERLNAVFVVLSEHLTALKSFQSFMVSVLRLECPAKSLSNAIAHLTLVVKRVSRTLAKLPKGLSVRNLTRLVKHVYPNFVNPVNVSEPAENRLTIAVIQSQSTEKLEKIIKDIRVILSETSGIYIEMRQK